MTGPDIQTKLKRIAGRLRGRGRHGLSFCLALAGLGGAPAKPEFRYVAALFEGLDDQTRTYWIGAFYSLLLRPEVRRRQAAYFTPPPLAACLISLAEAHGCDLRSATVFDPAAGGAAFLSTVAARMVRLGRPASECAKALRGCEIDPDLTVLARSLVGARLGLPPMARGRIRRSDALKCRIDERVDLVLANPPFGRRLGVDLEGVRWRHVASPGHVNIYALFVSLALRWAKPGGLVGLIIPSSFIGGPFYDRLRKHIRRRAEVVALGVVDERDDMFIDVAQDVCVLLLRRASEGHPKNARVRFGAVDADGRWVDSGRCALPDNEAAAWELPPPPEDAAAGGSTLADYGVSAQVGYLVWNREKERLRSTPEGGAVPLFWACNVRPGEICQPRARKRDGVDYVVFDQPSTAVIRGDAILMQRTTNSKQPRRLVAGLATAFPEGFTTENHTILLRPIRPDADLNLLCKLLNTRAVDQRYRRLSGTASVSVKLLRRLDLPAPSKFAAALGRNPDVERAARQAYGSVRRRQSAA